MQNQKMPTGDLDDVEARAAALHEQMAARRGADTDAGPPVDDNGTGPDPAGPPDTVPPDEDAPANRPTRRLAPPPWQMHTTIGSRDFAERFTADPPIPPSPDQSEGDHTAEADDIEDTEPTPPQPNRQPEASPAPPPPPGFLPPPPGWIPPPPPGWSPPSQGQRTAAAEEPETWASQGFRVPPSLDEAEIVHRPRHAPRSGWRRTVHRVSGGRINPGESRRDREKADLADLICQPTVGDFRIAVLSIKGGVGKTTTTLGLGSVLAMNRKDRVIALDANPDRGTLGERVRDASTRSTVRDLLSSRDIKGYADVRGHMLMADSHLEVLAGEQEPAVSEVFGEADYRRTVDILRHYYNIILTDCGTGIMHSAMAGVLDLAHAIVLVSSPAIDAARSASATLDWLMQHGHSALVREAEVVLSAARPGSATLKLDKVYDHFEARCRSVHLIPFDPHLAEGADIDFDLLKPATLQAYLELAGAVAEKFPRLRAGRHRQ